jgi:hypothetical protein
VTDCGAPAEVEGDMREGRQMVARPSDAAAVLVISGIVYNSSGAAARLGKV